MSRNKPPRKAYRPRIVTAHTMDLALHFAAKPAAADRNDVLAMLGTALQALREGVATEYQWSIAAGSGIVRGLLGHLKAAEQALQDIYDRALRTGGGHWVRVTLYYQELDALHTFLDLHTFQVHQLGRAEFLAAISAAHKDTIAQGHTVMVMREPERMAA